MKETKIKFPEKLPGILRMSEKEFIRELKFAASVKLFELGKISAGLAAELAGVDKVTFLLKLSDYGVSAINLRNEEIDYEIKRVKKLIREVKSS